MGHHPSRYASALLAFALVALGAGSAAAQPCQSSYEYTGSIQSGDGSSWSPFVVTVGAPGAGTYEIYRGGGGAVSWQSAGGPGGAGWQFYGRGGWPYWAAPPQGNVSCVDVPPTCRRCTGGFAINLYSLYANVKGTVRDADGVPVPTGTVSASLISPTPCSGGAYATATISNGSYDFKHPSGSNNWGALRVFGDGAGPGTATYWVQACIPGGEARQVTLTSNQVQVLDFNQPLRRCPNALVSAPNPNVGRPTNVLNGNVWFDHMDAVLPALAGTLRFERHYNSRHAFRGLSGVFGRGWAHSYERSLNLATPGWLRLREPDGSASSYQDADGDLTYAAAYPLDEHSHIVKSGSGTATTYTRHLVGGATEVFDASGRLTKEVNAAGFETTLAYNTAGRLVTVDGGGSRRLTLAYDGSGRMATLTGPAGTLATYTYVGATLTSLRYPDGSGYNFVYDGWGQVLRVTDASGTVVETHTYDPQGRGITSDLTDGVEKYTFAYQPDRTIVTDALGNPTTYEFVHAAGVKSISRITGPCSSCGGGGGDLQEWTYDAAGRIESYKDALGHITRYTYDARGNVLSERDPLERTTSYTYDDQDRVLTVTRPDESVTSATHGPSGPLTLTDPLVRTTTMDYEGPGARLSEVTDPRGKVTTLGYAAEGDLTSVSDPMGHATEFGHDLMGRRTTVTDPLEHTTTTTYDAVGRVTRVTTPDGAETDYAYDLGGRHKSTTDPLERVTRYVYDKYGRLEKMVDPLQGETLYGYDLKSRLTSLTDAKGNTTRFEYDPAGRLKKLIYPGGAFEMMTYDLAGRLITRTDRKNVTTTYAYDFASRLTGKTYSDGSPPVSYSYDLGDRMVGTANGVDTLGWTYDRAGQMLTETSARNSSTVAYSYDAAGNRLTLSLNGQLFVSYAHDDADRLTSLSREGRVFTFGYDNANRRLALGYPNGISTAYDPDEVGQNRSITATRGTDVIARSAYQHDLAGNRLSKAHAEYTETYGYDARDRLKQVDRTPGPPFASHWRNVYDPVGNRLSEEVDGAATSRTYDERNRLLSSSGSGTNGTYTYDHNGNLVSKNDGVSAWAYEWDVENRLRRVLKDGAEVARFTYDPLGRRLEKTAAGATTLFAYDGEDVLHQSSGAVSRTYIHGPSTDEPLAHEEAGAFRYYHADGLGSIVKLTDASGTVAHAYQYDAWGNVEVGPGTAGYTFTGREWDPETGLFYYRARYYDPKIGRFLSEDPIRFLGGFNFYSYVGNKPVNRIDPSGLAAGAPFPTADAAAIAAIQAMNPCSIALGREFFGEIFRVPGGFDYTPPKMGGRGTSRVPLFPESSTAWAGDYHTHGSICCVFSPIQSSPYEDFSPRDKIAAHMWPRSARAPSYLGTPSGKIKKWIPRGGWDPEDGTPVTLPATTRTNCRTYECVEWVLRGGQ